MDAVDDRAGARLTSRAVAALDDVRAAAALLSRVPLRRARERGTGAAAFGLVGGALGLLSAAVLLPATVAGPLPAALLGIATLAFVSGGLHLDGLADTADALAAPDRARAEAARLDPRAGPAGIATLVLVIALDAALLAEIVATGVSIGAAALIVATAGSRAIAAAMPLLARGRASGRRSGDWFIEGTTPGASWLALGSATLVAALGSALLGDSAVAFGGIGGIVVAAIGAEWLIRRRGGLDGDGIGAIVEITFAAILLFIVALERLL